MNRITRTFNRLLPTLANKVSAFLLMAYILIGLGADFLANEKPLYARIDNQSHWPVFKQMISKTNESRMKKPALDWSTIVPDFSIYPPVPFSSSSALNLTDRYLWPGTRQHRNGRSFRHWLGTDRLGRDVASGMIHGCRKSLFVGLVSMLIASFIGVSLGLLAGYWGNQAFSYGRLPSMAVVGLMGYLLYLLVNQVHLSALIYSVGLFLCLLVFVFFKRYPTMKGGAWYIPWDGVILRIIEVFNSIPGLLLLLVIGAMFARPSFIGVAVLIGLLRWTRFARFARGEIIKVKELEYITAARISGQSHGAIIGRYVIPAIVGPVIVVFTFGVASAILLESTLSFLGIGVPIDQITWGSLLGQARLNLQAWWLTLFPGAAIFLLIVVLNHLGDTLKKHL